MVFSSAVFLFIFLPVVFLLSRVIPGIRGKNILLLIASLLFYAFGEPVYVLLMIASIVINFTAGRLLVLCRNKAQAQLVTAAAVVLNLGMLSVFKYTDFFLSSLNQAFSLEIPLTGIALPVGISFFTFQGLSYVIDVYRDRSLCAYNIVKLALYISLFPQLIAGPIVIYHDVADQIDHRQTNPALTADGIRRFVIGLSKKLLIANTTGRMADLVFTASASQLDARAAWIGAVCYMLQIYFDFSGYSDMAIGLGRMLGFEFIENFNYPYISRSVVDFWKRWHISLTTWFREYLYFPLGGNRVPRWKWVRNILIVWLLTGLWHGAGWNFLLWGLYYALFMLAERLFLGKWLEKLPRALQHVYALFVVLIGWALFAVEDMGRLGAYLSACFGGAPLASAADGYYLMSYLPMLLILAVAATPLGKRLWDRAGERAHGVLLPVLTLAGLVLCTASLVDASYNPFLYFRF